MGHAFEQEALQQVPALIAEFLQVLTPPHVLREAHGVDLEVRTSSRLFMVEIKAAADARAVRMAIEQARSAASDAGPTAVPLVAVPFMGAVGAHICEQAGISWIDLSGNAHIVAPGLLVHVEGKPNRFKRSGRPGTVFAPKSSRVVRWLLMEPTRRWTQRELADAAGLDQGFTSRIVRRLEADGLVARDETGGVRSKEPRTLLETWRTAYAFDKHHIIKGHVTARTGEGLLQDLTHTLAEHKFEYAATGLGAVWLMNRFAAFRLATVYLRSSPSRELLQKLGFREEPRGANTWLVVPNDEGVFHGVSERDGITCVHPVQAYLDLKGHPERSAEAAERLAKELPA